MSPATTTSREPTMPMALGMLRADLAVPGTAVEVEIFGERMKAVVLADGPAWDAKNERIRA